MKRFRLLSAAALLASALLASACSDGSTEIVDCHRYDATALTEDNGFAATVKLDTPGPIDTGREHVELALSLVPPNRGTIDLVHVVGGIEADRWAFELNADQDTARCWVSPAGGSTLCAAKPLDTPYSPNGYYYLRTNGNTVLEAGLSFTVCR